MKMIFKRGFVTALVALFFLFSSLLRAELPDFTSLVENHSPSVVKIHTEIKSKKQHIFPRSYDQQIPEIFRHFFGDPRFQYERPPQEGMGSGFVIESDGYIVTNNHVVDGADVITVKLNDRDEYEAELIGVDPRSDLALIKIDAEGLTTARFAKQSVKVGEWVLAIGSPFGFDYTVSQGIVSALGRSLPTERNENYVPFIQTTVPINPGNSGGPLFNLQGEVVGVNSQIFTRSGGYMGLSFSIPAELAKNVIKQLKQNGYVSRGWLGVSIREVDKDLADAFKLDKPRGALVENLVSEGPAEKGGVLPGDIILSFNKESIKTSGDLPHVVGATPAGTESTLMILREGREIEISMILGELPDDPRKPYLGQIQKPKTDNPLGLIVEPVEESIQRDLMLPGGVLVREVVEDKPSL